MPVLSQRLGELPAWFWMWHLSPIRRGRTGRTCSLSESADRVNRARRAVSFAAQASRHVDRMFGLVNFSRRFTKASVSRMFLPKTISAGDRPQSGSGVFLSCSIARRKRSLSKDPDGSTLARRSRFADLTATSALPFDCGWYADETL